MIELSGQLFTFLIYKVRVVQYSIFMQVVYCYFDVKIGASQSTRLVPRPLFARVLGTKCVIWYGSVLKHTSN